MIAMHRFSRVLLFLFLVGIQEDTLFAMYSMAASSVPSSKNSIGSVDTSSDEQGIGKEFFGRNIDITGVVVRPILLSGKVDLDGLSFENINFLLKKTTFKTYLKTLDDFCLEDGLEIMRGDLIKILSVAGSEINDEQLHELFELFPNIEFLNLANCARVTDKTLFAATDKCEELQACNLFGCSKITLFGFTFFKDRSCSLTGVVPPEHISIELQRPNIQIIIDPPTEPVIMVTRQQKVINKQFLSALLPK